jgi:hypothetical protein
MGTGIDLFLDWENGIRVAGTAWDLATGNGKLRGFGGQVVSALAFHL